MAQNALFPMTILNVTQAYGSKTSTHKFGYAIDVAGKDSSIENAYAPFDCKVRHRYAPSNWSLGHTVWFESLAKVRFADGTLDYATVSMTHDNDVSNLPEGKTFKQGQVIYQEGTAGRATGNHIHLEVAKGKFSGTGWSNIGGEWVLNNKYKPEKMLFLRDVTIKNAGGLTWTEEETMIDELTFEIFVRSLVGEAATDAEKKGHVGRYTPREAWARIKTWERTKANVAKAKKGQLNAA